MPSIKQTQIGTALTLVEPTLISGTVSLAYRRGIGQVLIIDNKSASAINPALTGRQAPSALAVEGLGNIDLSDGFPVGSIASGAVVAIKLDNVRRWLTGAVELSGATGATAFVTTVDAVPQHALWIQSGRLIADGRLVANSKLWGV